MDEPGDWFKPRTKQFEVVPIHHTGRKEALDPHAMGCDVVRSVVPGSDSHI
jgi:hypothetical protein